MPERSALDGAVPPAPRRASVPSRRTELGEAGRAVEQRPPRTHQASASDLRRTGLLRALPSADRQRSRDRAGAKHSFSASAPAPGVPLRSVGGRADLAAERSATSRRPSDGWSTHTSVSRRSQKKSSASAWTRRRNRPIRATSRILRTSLRKMTTAQTTMRSMRAIWRDAEFPFDDAIVSTTTSPSTAGVSSRITAARRCSITSTRLRPIAATTCGLC